MFPRRAVPVHPVRKPSEADDAQGPRSSVNPVSGRIGHVPRDTSPANRAGDDPEPTPVSSPNPGKRVSPGSDAPDRYPNRAHGRGP